MEAITKTAATVTTNHRNLSLIAPPPLKLVPITYTDRGHTPKVHEREISPFSLPANGYPVFLSFTPVESIKVVTAVTRRIGFPFLMVINRLKLLKKTFGLHAAFPFSRLTA